MFGEIQKFVQEAKELLNFTGKQYDDLLDTVTTCEDENQQLRNEKKVLKKALESLETLLKSVMEANNDLY